MAKESKNSWKLNHASGYQGRTKKTEDIISNAMTTELQKLDANHEAQIHTMESNYQLMMQAMTKC